jgi:hypothetical protein
MRKTSCGTKFVGNIFLKCLCKACFVRGCCKENVIWSMVLNPSLVLLPKYAKLEPGARKRRGSPTEKRRFKRVAKLKEAEGEVDFVPL